MLQELTSRSSACPRRGRFAEAGVGCVPGQRNPSRTRLPLPRLLVRRPLSGASSRAGSTASAAGPRDGDIFVTSCLSSRLNVTRHFHILVQAAW